MSLDISLIIMADVGTHEPYEIEMFEANITHNLGSMAIEAGIYEALWRPEEIGVTKAEELINLLKTGVDMMEADPHRFINFNAENKWGTYDQFLPWVKDYLDACRKFPAAIIRVSR